MMLQQPMTCSMPAQNKMAPPMSAMAFRDATTTVMSNMYQQQPMMTNPDVARNPDVNKTPDANKTMMKPDVNKRYHSLRESAKLFACVLEIVNRFVSDCSQPLNIYDQSAICLITAAYHQSMIYIIYYNKCMYDKMPLKALK